MEFRDYWQNHLKPGEERESFAARCNTTVGYLNLVAGGFKTPGETLCLHIERETGGKVAVEQLRSDVPWGVIRNKRAKPLVKARAA